MNENIENVLATLDGFRTNNEMTYSAYSTLHDEISLLDDLLKEQEPDASKYQYKYDHTDCIWYRDSRSKCPVTCSQYRDGWNDAMDFVFKNGAGYSPYKRR